MESSEPLLVWRSTEEAEYVPITAGEHGRGFYCPYCGELLVKTSVQTADWQGDLSGMDCFFCGWTQWHMEESWCSLYDEAQDRQAILLERTLSDPDLAISEIRAALSHSPSMAVELTPRRFEEVVHSVYRELGYDAVLTQQSKDEGRDLILFGKSPKDFAIVEVKRYANRVGVELVRQLRGVQLREDAPRAILVTTTGFTAGAKKEAAHRVPARKGYAMELVLISELLSEIAVTHEPLADVMASGRGRENYRRWFNDTFQLSVRDTVNPLVESGGPKTLITGWWRS